MATDRECVALGRRVGDMVIGPCLLHGEMIAEWVRLVDGRISALCKTIEAQQECAREARADAAKIMERLDHRISEASRLTHAAEANLRRLDQAEQMTELMDVRLRAIEGIEARREGIDAKVDALERAVTAIVTSLKTLKGLAIVLAALLSVTATIVSWVMMHGQK
jgi:hypothetical protein